MFDLFEREGIDVRILEIYSGKDSTEFIIFRFYSIANSIDHRE